MNLIPDNENSEILSDALETQNTEVQTTETTQDTTQNEALDRLESVMLFAKHDEDDPATYRLIKLASLSSDLRITRTPSGGGFEFFHAINRQISQDLPNPEKVLYIYQILVQSAIYYVIKAYTLSYKGEFDLLCDSPGKFIAIFKTNLQSSIKNIQPELVEVLKDDAVLRKKMYEITSEHLTHITDKTNNLEAFPHLFSFVSLLDEIPLGEEVFYMILDSTLRDYL